MLKKQINIKIATFLSIILIAFLLGVSFPVILQWLGFCPSALSIGPFEFTSPNCQETSIENNEQASDEATQTNANPLQETIVSNNQTTVEGSSNDSIQVVISPTPKPQYVPNGYVFIDSFDQGKSSDWREVYGDLGVSNGQYTVNSLSSGQTVQHVALLENHYWKNVEVTVEMARLTYGVNGCDVASGQSCPFFGAGGIIIRSNPDGSGFGLVVNAKRLGIIFAYFEKNGERTVIPNTYVAGTDGGFDLENDLTEITVIAQGSYYTAYINGIEMTSVEAVDVPTEGEIALFFQTGSQSGQPENTVRYDQVTVKDLSN